MPVNTKHPDHKTFSAGWDKCRTAVEGEAAVKAKRVEVIPMLSGQSTNEYEAYLKRALYYNASGRTAQGLTGVVFRKQPSVVFPESKKSFLDNVGTVDSPKSFESFARMTMQEVITTGRYGVLLDTESTEDNAQPYFSGYRAESIINWTDEMVVLEEETLEVSPNDEFELKKVKRIRVLDLTNNLETDVNALQQMSIDSKPSEQSENLVYRIRVYDIDDAAKAAGVARTNKATDEDQYVLSRVIIPSIRGKHLNYIPFFFFGPIEPSAYCQKSPIEDVVDVNLSHFRSSADIEHGRHFTALPTLFVSGVKKGTVLHVGSETAITAEDPNADAKYLEFAGSGLGSLKDAMEQKEQYMAVLGARMLEEQKKAVEASETVERRVAGEMSTLAAVASSVEAGFEAILKRAAEWLGSIDAEVSVMFNKDYMPKSMEPQMLTALVTALQGGNMSWDTFAYNLAKGEIYPEGRTAEQEMDLIEDDDKRPLPLGPSKPSKDDIDLDDDDEEEDDDDES